MEYLDNYITEISKLNLKSLKLDIIKDIPLNDIFIFGFKNYKKYFLNVKSDIYVNKSNNVDNLKNTMVNFYKEFVDNEASSQYNFIQDVNNIKNIYEVIIEQSKMFRFYVYSEDINYFSKILHLFNVFTNYALDNPEKYTGLHFSNFNTRKKFLPIYIYPNDIKRKLAGNIFFPDHLDIYKKTNEAFTTSGVTASGYYMYFSKKEELSKLQLHELIHLYKLDGSCIKVTDSLKKIRNYMPFTDNNDELESVAELMSNIYNCMNLCLIISKDKNLTDQEELKLLSQLIYIEKEYSIFVVAKILKYFNIQPHQLFNFNKKKIKLVSPINLYYIMRSVIYSNFDDLFVEDNINPSGENILELNHHIFAKLKNYINEASNPESLYMKKLYLYYENLDMDNLSVSYIALDIDFDNIDFDNISVNDTNNYLIKQQGAANLENYFDKYLKYKSKYLDLKEKF